jgi:hypothetical protein
MSIWMLAVSFVLEEGSLGEDEGECSKQFDKIDVLRYLVSSNITTPTPTFSNNNSVLYQVNKYWSMTETLMGAPGSGIASNVDFNILSTQRCVRMCLDAIQLNFSV